MCRLPRTISQLLEVPNPTLPRPSLTMRAHEIAARLGGQGEGNLELEVTGVASLERATDEQISFVVSPRLAEQARRSQAGCLVVPLSFPRLADRTLIRVAEPRAAFAQVVRWFRVRPRPPVGRHPSAVVDATAQIGEGTSLGPHCVVGAQVRIGRDCVVHGNVTIYDGVTIGDRVVVHAGTVIGGDGFGFVPVGDHFERFPQVGGVEIGDDVEIGANCTIDCGALDATRIGAGTKIDNLVHLAHSCVLGQHVLIAAQTGLAGGVTVGDRVVMGGQVGVGDKARIESGAVLGAQTGVPTAKFVAAGESMWGTPARPLRRYLKQLAEFARIGKLLRALRRGSRSMDGAAE